MVRIKINDAIAALRKVAIAFFMSFLTLAIWGQKQTFTTSGTFTVPSGVTSIIVECWGGGGSGGGTTANNSRGGGGGAGGAYARKLLDVTPGQSFTVTVGGVKTGTQGAGATGNPSWFDAVTTVYAEGGAGGAAPNGGTAAGGTGSAANSIGDLVFAGGSGAAGTATYSGGGGGGAGSTGAGGNASGRTAGTGTTLSGGNGGTGRNTEGNGAAGSAYGGGGSGAYLPDNTNHSGGAGAAGLVVVSWSVSTTYNTTTTFTVPAGVSSITVECWGAGGAGGGVNGLSANGGGGGGGGAYSRSTITVKPGTPYTVTVGSGGTGSTGDGTAGGDTWFGSATTIMAKGGAGGSRATSGSGGAGGAGGTAAGSIGTVKYNGGTGGAGATSTTGRGGPGGSSAGIASNGTSGSTPWSTTTAGTPPTGGGSGGNGGGTNTNGSPGSVPGGAGGGSGEGTRSGGAGANGQVTISWSYPVFYSVSSGNPSDTTFWETTAGYAPYNFTTANQTYRIKNGHAMTIGSGGWTVSGSGSVVEIMDGGILTENYAASFSSGTIFLVDDGGRLNHNVNSVTIFGGGESFGPTSTIDYGFAGGQNVVDETYGNLTLSGSGSKTISSSTVNGILSIEGTATASAAPTYGTDAALQYKGSSLQTTGPEFPSIFSGTGGIIIDNINDVTLASGKTITELLTFISGRINTGSYTLVIGSTGDITGAGSGSYVNGTLRMDIGAATASQTFEIGSASGYTPVTVDFTGTTNATGNITASTTQSDHPNIATSAINPSYSVNRYWTLTNSGVTGFTSFDATFTFLAADADAGTDFNSFITAKYYTGTWSYPTPGARSSTTTRVTALTTFGDFQIGHLVSDFRSAGTGNWSQAATWEIYAGGSWITAPATPTFANGTITITSPCNVTIDSPVTLDQLIVNSGASVTLGADVFIADGTGTDMNVNGTLTCPGSYKLTGDGSFVLSSSANLYIGSPDGISSSGATGSIQTAARTFSTGANYFYDSSASQVTGTGLPGTVNNLTITNASGVALSSSMSISGSLILSAGPLDISSRTLTFLNSDTPLSRTSGTLTVSDLTDIAFGDAGNTGGSAFTIPDGIFTTAPVINNLTVYRANGIIMNNQVMSVTNIVLCNGPLNTNNNLVLTSTASSTALIDGRGTGIISGNVTMQRYLSSGFGYKYISSPFQASGVSELSPEINLSSSFPLVYKYVEERTSSGWVSYVRPDSLLRPMHGYSANYGSAAVPLTFDIKGTVNRGTLTRTLYNHNYTYTKGMNLVGNPYPSPIDWNAGSGWTKTNIDNAIYFFKASTTDQYGGIYASYVNGVSSDTTVNNFIPSMQGFFVHVKNGTYPVTGTLTMNDSVRVNNFSQPFTKSASKGGPPLIRLSASFSADPDVKDYMLVYTDEKASGSFDGEYDGLKIMNTDLKVPNIFVISPESYNLSISAIPPLQESSLRIPLGVKANRAGTMIFKMQAHTGTFESDDIAIYDAVTGISQRLNNGEEYVISLPVAEYRNRFFLDINYITTGLEDTPPAEGKFRVWMADGILMADIDGFPGSSAELVLTNLAGQRLMQERIYSGGHYEFNVPLTGGIYFMTIYSSSGKSVQKFIVH